MIRRISGVALSVVLAFSFCGCSDDAAEPVVVDPATGMEALPSSELKSYLQEIAANPAPVGSGIGRIRTGIEDLRATNATLADELAAEATKLEQATSPDQIKAIAQGMADKL
jgi:hypothetical protein